MIVHNKYGAENTRVATNVPQEGQVTMMSTNNVRHGVCTGGPRSGQTLATQQPGVVSHQGDDSGFYVYKSAVGPDPARWLWITTKEPRK